MASACQMVRWWSHDTDKRGDIVTARLGLSSINARSHGRRRTRSFDRNRETAYEGARWCSSMLVAAAQSRRPGSKVGWGTLISGLTRRKGTGGDALISSPHCLASCRGGPPGQPNAHRRQSLCCTTGQSTLTSGRRCRSRGRCRDGAAGVLALLLDRPTRLPAAMTSHVSV